jgi:hypothetical protein
VEITAAWGGHYDAIAHRATGKAGCPRPESGMDSGRHEKSAIEARAVHQHHYKAPPQQGSSTAESHLPCGGDELRVYVRANGGHLPDSGEGVARSTMLPHSVAGSTWFTAPVELSRSQAARQSAILIAPTAVVQILRWCLSSTT